MNVTILFVIETYKEKLNELMNENILLKAQLKQLQNDMNKKDEGEIGNE